MSQNVPKCPIQKHRGPNGLVYIPVNVGKKSIHGNRKRRKEIKEKRMVHPFFTALY